MSSNREIKITDVKRKFSSALNRAERGDRLIITRRGRPAGALVSIEDLELIEYYKDELDIGADRKARK